jgi:hypothetical protein
VRNRVPNTSFKLINFKVDAAFDMKTNKVTLRTKVGNFIIRIIELWLDQHAEQSRLSISNVVLYFITSTFRNVSDAFYYYLGISLKC